MLKDPETRRGLRSGIQAVVTLAILYFVWSWSPRLDNPGLLKVILSLLVIVGMQTLGYIMENGLRAFKLSAGKDGVSVEAGGEE